ncbi:unnamed protein product [Peronospora farinosa]|uniref:Integrase catalytic domain-containing protein n=1 Tax=Peronospora farinosa TaxID=134698 RepID=A0AAV0U7S6_9STRA|nr:unnamed protein product [Peronospora farinosa]
MGVKSYGDRMDTSRLTLRCAIVFWSSKLSARSTAVVIHAALEEEATADVSPDVQKATLVNFHQMFGHFSYDTIERIAKNPGSEIRITDQRRLTCITCAQNKQTKNSQIKKDTGVHSPIDRVRGVIWQTGVARQVSEARIQASNGKAESMHRTVLNMTRAMIFASGLLLTFWGDAAEYATYNLNRSPTSANPKRASFIEVLTKRAPDLRKIVIFGSHVRCTAIHGRIRSPIALKSAPSLVKATRRKGSVFTCARTTLLSSHNMSRTSRHFQQRRTQLQRELESDDRADANTSSDAQEPAHAMQREHKAYSKKPRKTHKWTRQPIATRAASKKSSTSQDEAARSTDVVSHVFEPDLKNHREAIKSTKCLNWKEAMEEKLAALEANDVCAVVRRPSGSNVLHSRWVFKTKKTEVINA